MTNLTVLSAMITPAVLIPATGSLLLTTSQRLSLSIERARKLAAELEKGNEDPHWSLFVEQLHFAARRRRAVRQAGNSAPHFHRCGCSERPIAARLLQRAMVSLYLALGSFVACSIAIGPVELTHQPLTWLPVTFGFIGARLLLAASGILILEARIALRSVSREMAALTKGHF